MDELERFRIRMIGEEHNRCRRQEKRHHVWTELIAMLKTWLTR